MKTFMVLALGLALLPALSANAAPKTEKLSGLVALSCHGKGIVNYLPTVPMSTTNPDAAVDTIAAELMINLILNQTFPASLKESWVYVSSLMQLIQPIPPFYDRSECLCVQVGTIKASGSTGSPSIVASEDLFGSSSISKVQTAQLIVDLAILRERIMKNGDAEKILEETATQQCEALKRAAARN